MDQRIIKRNQIPIPHWFLHKIKHLAVGFSGIQAMLPSMAPFSHKAQGFGLVDFPYTPPP
jgi:hypothetical protein